jgi:hypothetical protein
MADISAIAPVAIHRSNLQRPNIPSLRIRASFAAISIVLGNALNMAYVDPYTSHRRRPQVAPDDDLEGRDPTW